jgi:glycine/D-amino acid oxidase-like deaminating enzyme
MEPADYVGFVGRNSGDKHRYIATGDSGQGITNGVIASMLIAKLILDGNKPLGEGIRSGAHDHEEHRRVPE